MIRGLRSGERVQGHRAQAEAYYRRGLLRQAVDQLEQAVRIASQLDGGLTRVNFMIALRNMDMTAPFLLEGAKLNMHGNKDAYFVEASEFGKYDSAQQSFVKQGDVIDLSGKSSNCAWDQSTASCK